MQPASLQQGAALARQSSDGRRLQSFRVVKDPSGRMGIQFDPTTMIIRTVMLKTPASNAGLAPGMKIHSIDGRTVSNDKDYAAALSAAPSVFMCVADTAQLSIDVTRTTSRRSSADKPALVTDKTEPQAPPPMSSPEEAERLERRSSTKRTLRTVAAAAAAGQFMKVSRQAEEAAWVSRGMQTESDLQVDWAQDRLVEAERRAAEAESRAAAAEQRTQESERQLKDAEKHAKALLEELEGIRAQLQETRDKSKAAEDMLKKANDEAERARKELREEREGGKRKPLRVNTSGVSFSIAEDDVKPIDGTTLSEPDEVQVEETYHDLVQRLKFLKETLGADAGKFRKYAEKAWDDVGLTQSRADVPKPKQATPEKDAKDSKREKPSAVQLAAETTAAPSKFDASDQVGQATTKGKADVDEYDRSPEMLSFYPAGYVAPTNALQTVQDLRNWSDPKGRLWPEWAIQRLSSNCSMMTERHSHGEPRDVVIPLFTYSTFMLEDCLWAVWAPNRVGGGRWTVLRNSRDLDMGYLELLIEASEAKEGDKKVPTRLAQPEETKKRKMSLRHGKTIETLQEILQLNAGATDDDSRPTDGQWLSSGQMTLVSQHAAPGSHSAPPWAGLTIFASEDCSHMLGTADGEDSPVAREPSTPEDWEVAARRVFLARYSVPGNALGLPANPTQPLHDNALWLPPPSLVFSHEWSKLPPFLVEPGTAESVRTQPPAGAGLDMKRSKRGSGFFGGNLGSSGKMPRRTSMFTTMSQTWLPSDKGLTCLPPPGLMEYVFSRRSDEVLKMHKQGWSSGTRTSDAAGSDFGDLRERESNMPEDRHDRTLFQVKKVELGAAGHRLVTRCQQERNQQQYSSTLHRAFSELMQASIKDGGHAAPLRSISDESTGTAHDDDDDAVSEGVVREVKREVLDRDVATKVMQVLQLKTGEDVETSRPSPLTIAHSFDLQDLIFGDKSWVVGFSGKPCCLVWQDVCVPVFRLVREFMDQPYWHLNCSMRNLQFRKGSGTLWVKKQETGRKRQADFRTKTINSVAGDYLCPKPETLGLGLATMANVASLMDKNKVRSTFDTLRHKAWEVVLRCESQRDVFVSWENKTEAAWRASQTVFADNGLTAPFDKAPREEGRFVVRGPKFGNLVLEEHEASLDLGTWMLPHCRPLIWHIHGALRSMRPLVGSWVCKPDGSMKLYRGLGGVTLNSRVYARGKVLLWGQYSSSSKDQGIAQQFAIKGNNASVFILEGFSCRLIAPWSRFGREEEWLFPLNTLWQLTQLLTQEQQQILGKGGFQLYEMQEVDDSTMNLIQVRSVLSKATTGAAASVVFFAEQALKGAGILNMSLRSPSEGSTSPMWSYRADVTFTATTRCPLAHNASWRECDHEVATDLVKKVKDAASHAETGDGVVEFQASANIDESSRKVLQGTAKVLDIPLPYKVVLLNMTDNSMDFTVIVNTQGGLTDWEATVRMRQLPGREGSAMKDEGAYLLSVMLQRCVPLEYIDIRNNGIGVKGACDLLLGVRANRKVFHLSLDTVGAPAAEKPRECMRLDALRRDLLAMQKDPFDLGYTRSVQAINLRCMQHQGPLSTAVLDTLGTGWPLIAAVALYDLEDIQLDFDAVMSKDAQSGTRLAEQFVMYLVQMCLKMGAKFPRLPGALVAASVYGSPCFIRLLLDIDCSKLETDDYGEAACLKVERRHNIYWRCNSERKILADYLPVAKDDDREQETQLSGAVHVLKVTQPNTMVTAPRNPWISDAAWRAKHFGLEMCRLWYGKQRVNSGLADVLDTQGSPTKDARFPCYGVLEELLQNFYQSYKYANKLMQESARLMAYGAEGEHNDAPNSPRVGDGELGRTTGCPLSSLRELAHKLLSRSRNSSIARTPVSRIGVTLLSYHFFHNEVEYRESHSDSDAGDGVPKPRDAVDGVLKPLHLHETLTNASLTVYRPGTYNTMAMVPEARADMGRWIGCWGLLSAVLTVLDPREEELVTVMSDQPRAVFNSHVSLKKGDDYCIPGPSLWRRKAKNEPELAASTAPNSVPFSRIRLEAKGKFSYEDIGHILRDKDFPLCLPGLSMFLVYDTALDEKSSLLTISLVARGTLFNTDSELGRFRDDILAQGERAEEALGLGAPESSSERGTKVMAALAEWDKTRRQREKEEQDEIEESDARLLTRRKVQYVVPQTNVFCSQASVMRSRAQIFRMTDEVVTVVGRCSGFSEFKIGKKEGKSYSNGDKAFHTDYGFHTTKRLGAVLLGQLGRLEQPERVQRIWGSLMRRIELQPPLLDRLDHSEEIVVNTNAIEESHRQAQQKEGMYDEDLNKYAGETGAPVTSLSWQGNLKRGAGMYGDQTFKVTISELQQTLQSTLLVLGEETPRLFLLDFIRRFAMTEFSWFLRATRSTPLIILCDDLRYKEAEATLLSLQRARLASFMRLRDDYRKQLGEVEDMIASRKQTDFQVTLYIRNVSGSGKLSEEKEEKSTNSNDALARLRLVSFETHKLIERIQQEVGRFENHQETVGTIRGCLKQWREAILGDYEWWGFRSKDEVVLAFSKSLVEVSTAICVSQKGYFLANGRRPASVPRREGDSDATESGSDGKSTEEYNQICGKTASLATFLQASGIDFTSTFACKLECVKYFQKDKDSPTSPDNLESYLSDWSDWRPGGRDGLHKRIKALYRLIFTSAKQQGVRNLSMIPLGLGMFLGSLSGTKSERLKDEVVLTYFRSQFELLTEEDWGFENYFINAQNYRKLAEDLLGEETKTGKDYNCPMEGIYLRCNVVFHNRDAKFLAYELANNQMFPGLLVPSDSQSLVLGQAGMNWELGRGRFYRGEEDWAATTTGFMMNYSIARSALGLDDVVFKLNNGGRLYVSKVFGRRGVLCNVCHSERHGAQCTDCQLKAGPFTDFEPEVHKRKIKFIKPDNSVQEFQLAGVHASTVSTLIKWVRALLFCPAQTRPDFDQLNVFDGKFTGEDGLLSEGSRSRRPSGATAIPTSFDEAVKLLDGIGPIERRELEQRFISSVGDQLDDLPGSISQLRTFEPPRPPLRRLESMEREPSGRSSTLRIGSGMPALTVSGTSGHLRPPSTPKSSTFKS
eukprot:Hpha_TRINITY_DN16445_c5_g10::TRINITY_DN16445_c5_g10_i1::g.159125::m.159125